MFNIVDHFVKPKTKSKHEINDPEMGGRHSFTIDRSTTLNKSMSTLRWSWSTNFAKSIFLQSCIVAKCKVCYLSNIKISKQRCLKESTRPIFNLPISLWSIKTRLKVLLREPSKLWFEIKKSLNQENQEIIRKNPDSGWNSENKDYSSYLRRLLSIL